ALIPLAGIGLGASWRPWACFSDASMWGYAVATSHFNANELRGIGRGDPLGTEVAVRVSLSAAGDDDAAFAGLGQPPLGRGTERRRRVGGIDYGAIAAAACRGGILALPDSALAAHRWQLVVRGAFLFAAPVH
ncbi:unnamed protein product, partial [Prorocentrum cordatum]